VSGEWLQRVCANASQDLQYDGGIVHILDKFLTIPPSALEILSPLSLTAAEAALTKATKLESQLLKTDVTLFVPNNKAFEAFGSVFGNVSGMQLSSTLGCHIVPKVTNYLAPSGNTPLPTFLSEDIYTVAEDRNILVNSAEVILRNVLAAEGVIHLIHN
jgi:uncharacterized surface protein with fasciclin (FAS1) repeats